MTTDFSNAFANNNNQDNDSYEGPSKEDYQAWHQRVVDVCGTQDKAKSVSGYISGVISLGRQEVEDGMMDWGGTPEEEAAILAKEGNKEYFKDYTDPKNGVTKRVKCWPQNPRLGFAITVDFPKLLVEGLDGVKRPVRMLLNKEFNPKGSKERILGRVFEAHYDNPKKHNGKFTIKFGNILYKLALATEIIKAGDMLSHTQLGGLIGKYANFEMRAYINDKGYFEEDIKFKGAVSEEVKENGLLAEVDASTLYFLDFYSDSNNEEFLKNTRKAVKNQMKRATDYDQSGIKNQLEGGNTPNDGNTPSDSSVSPSDSVEEGNQGQPTGVPVKQAQEASGQAYDKFDDDIPF